PVKTQFGYYVFEVTKITTATQQSLAQATDTIRNLLKSQSQQTALNNFVKDFQKRYRDKTVCAKGFTTSQCSNGPNPQSSTQDERTIVPHTVEEAYELADAANKRDDAKLLDELGDVLFQVHFLSLLLEERGAGDLAAVAEGCCAKLIRRHPHVFGDVEVEDAA